MSGKNVHLLFSHQFVSFLLQHVEIVTPLYSKPWGSTGRPQILWARCYGATLTLFPVCLTLPDSGGGKDQLRLHPLSPSPPWQSDQLLCRSPPRCMMINSFPFFVKVPASSSEPGCNTRPHSESLRCEYIWQICNSWIITYFFEPTDSY